MNAAFFWIPAIFLGIAAIAYLIGCMVDYQSKACLWLEVGSIFAVIAAVASFMIICTVGMMIYTYENDENLPLFILAGSACVGVVIAFIGCFSRYISEKVMVIGGVIFLCALCAWLAGVSGATCQNVTVISPRGGVSVGVSCY